MKQAREKGKSIDVIGDPFCMVSFVALFVELYFDRPFCLLIILRVFLNENLVSY